MASLGHNEFIYWVYGRGNWYLVEGNVNSVGNRIYKVLWRLYYILKDFALARFLS